MENEELLNDVVNKQLELLKTESDNGVRMPFDDLEKLLRIEKEVRNEENSKKFFLRDTAIEIGKVGVPMLIYAGLFLVGLKFEETGNITSHFFKDLIRRFPKK